jgi:hypothetical protein
VNCFIKGADKGTDSLCDADSPVSYIPGDTNRMSGRESLSTKDRIDNEKSRARA